MILKMSFCINNLNYVVTHFYPHKPHFYPNYWSKNGLHLTLTAAKLQVYQQLETLGDDIQVFEIHCVKPSQTVYLMLFCNKFSALSLPFSRIHKYSSFDDTKSIQINLF